MSHTTWMIGPLELIKFALEQIHNSSDVSRRIALIHIDNAVEIMLRVFATVPQRDGGLGIPQKDVPNNFPELLKLIGDRVPDRFNGVSLTELERCHRMRNSLYHEWDGTTVNRSVLDIHAKNVRALFENLFSVAIPDVPKPVSEDNLRDLKVLWDRLSGKLRELNERRMVTKPPLDDPVHTVKRYFGQPFEERYLALMEFRNRVDEGARPLPVEIHEHIFIAQHLIRDVEEDFRQP